MYQTEILGQSLSSGRTLSFAKSMIRTTPYPCKSLDPISRPEDDKTEDRHAGRSFPKPPSQSRRRVGIWPRERFVEMARQGLQRSRHRSVGRTHASEGPDKTLPATSAAKDAGGASTAGAGAVQGGHRRPGSSDAFAHERATVPDATGSPRSSGPRLLRHDKRRASATSAG